MVGINKEQSNNSRILIGVLLAAIPLSFMLGRYTGSSTNSYNLYGVTSSAPLRMPPGPRITTESNREAIRQEWRKIVVERAEGPEGHARFSMIRPTVDWPRTKMQRVGVQSGDGGKWLAGLYYERNHNKRFVVASVGSNMDFSFEIGLQKLIPQAVIHSFDCTVSAADASSDAVPSFVRMHRFCISNRYEPSSDGKSGFIPWGDALKLMGVQQVDLLKADIEGAEYILWDSILSEAESGGGRVPNYVSFEMHYKTMFKEMWPGSATEDGQHGQSQSMHAMAALLERLDKNGYRIMQNEPNELCPHCTEITVGQVPWLEAVAREEW